MTKTEELKKDSKRGSAFMKPVHVTPELAAIVGNTPIPRTEIAKLLWVYIKKNNLQSKTDKRMIEPDAKLAKVFGSPQPITMFQMTSKVSRHIVPAKPTTATNK